MSANALDQGWFIIMEAVEASMSLALVGRYKLYIAIKHIFPYLLLHLNCGAAAKNIILQRR